MSVPEDQLFGDPELLAQEGGSLRAVGPGATNPYVPTQGGDDLNASTLNIQQDGRNILSQMGLLGAELQFIIDLLSALGGWIAGLFQGVPEQAKTIGTGQQLVTHLDSVTQFIGLQLMGGGGAGRLLSEGNWPQNFGGRVLAVGGALIEFVNREPPGAEWRVRNTTPTEQKNFNVPPRLFRVGPIPPPTGAPYSQTVTVDGFLANYVRSASDFKNQFGIDIPTPGQIQQFIHDTGGVQWNDGQVPLSRLEIMREAFLARWIAEYQKWLSQQTTIPPGQPPDPCFGSEDIPCPPLPTTKGDTLSQLISSQMTYLYFIARYLQQLGTAAMSPQDQVCCANITAQISAVQTQLRAINVTLAANPPPEVDLTATSAALTSIAQQVMQWPALWQTIAGDHDAKLQAITDAIANIDINVDTTGIEKALNAWNALNDIPVALLNQLVADKVIPASYQSYLQGSPAEIVKAVLAAAGMFSSPIDMAKLLSGDSSSLTGSSKKVYDDVVREFPAVLNALKPIVNADAKAIGSVIQIAMQKFISANDAVFAPVVVPLVTAIKNLLSPPPGASVGPTYLGVNPDNPIAAATGVALTAAVAGWVAQGFGLENGENLKRIAEIVGAAVGWEQLRDVQIGPYVRNGIGADAERQAKALMRQWYPGVGEAASLYARGLNGLLGTQNILAWNGLSDPFIQVMINAAYHGLQPRQLIRAFESGLFTSNDLGDEMTFSGMRPASQARMQLLAPYLATATQRSALKSAVMEAFAEGTIDIQTMENYLTGAEHNTNAVSLEEQTAIVKLSTRNTLALEKGYTDLFVQGFNDLATYQANLTSIGLPSSRVSVLVAIAENHQTLIAKRQQAQAERVLARETAAVERQAAMKSYRSGQTNAAVLTAALLATGLTAAQTAAWVELATLQATGVQSWIYGLQKTPNDKQLLQSRVTDLIDQRKRELIDGTTFIKQLQALGIPEHYQNALLARANALITPKKDAILNPVETNT